MKLSVLIAQRTGDWAVAKRAEELGLHAVWYGDCQMTAADPVVVMTAAAMNTSRIRLGTGLLIPSNRIAPQTACSFASLNSYAPGRINLGIGTGFSGRRTMGLGPVKMADLRNYVETIAALLRGETIEWEFENEKHKVRFLNADKDVTNLTDPIDIYVGAQGPKMRRLTAGLKAHWMSIFTTLDATAEDIKDMRQARLEAGCAPEAFKNAITLFGYPLTDGETIDSPHVMRQVGPLAAVALHNILEAEQLGALGTAMGMDAATLDRCQSVYQSYQPADAKYLTLHRGHALFMREDEAEFVTPEWIQQTTMTAPIGQVRETIRELKNMGYEEISFVMNTYHPADIKVLERWVDVMEGV